MMYREDVQTKLRNKFTRGKLGQTARSIITFTPSKCSLRMNEMAMSVGQINRAVQEVNDLARENKKQHRGVG
ncbi:MAG: hypothetical protein ACTTKL_11605 [Treponema sp.]